MPETNIIRFKYTDGSLYASQTFNDAPDGRRILVAKGQVSGLNPMLNSLITFPIELTLRRTDEGLRIHQNPVAELDRLRIDTISVPGGTIVSDGRPLTVWPAARLLDIEMELTPAGAGALTLEILGKEIRLDLQAMELQFHEELEDNDVRAPLALLDGRLDLRLLVDTIFLESLQRARPLLHAGPVRLSLTPQAPYCCEPPAGPCAWTACGCTRCGRSGNGRPSRAVRTEPPASPCRARTAASSGSRCGRARSGTSTGRAAPRRAPRCRRGSA